MKTEISVFFDEVLSFSVKAEAENYKSAFEKIITEFLARDESIIGVFRETVEKITDFSLRHYFSFVLFSGDSYEKIYRGIIEISDLLRYEYFNQKNLYIATFVYEKMLRLLRAEKKRTRS